MPMSTRIHGVRVVASVVNGAYVVTAETDANDVSTMSTANVARNGAKTLCLTEVMWDVCSAVGPRDGYDNSTCRIH